MGEIVEIFVERDDGVEAGEGGKTVRKASDNKFVKTKEWHRMGGEDDPWSAALASLLGN
jgi:hypothetical protein